MEKFYTTPQLNKTEFTPIAIMDASNDIDDGGDVGTNVGNEQA